MKGTVMDVVKTVANAVFSFGGFMFVTIMAVLYLMITVSANDAARNAACLKAGMVQVRINGSNFCVAPTHLVEIK